MAKLTLPTVKTGYNLNQINENFQSIVDELQNKVLYRNNPAGEPNQWETQQDANSNRLINLPDAVSAKEPVTLSQLLSFVIQQAPAGSNLVVETTGAIGTSNGTVFDLDTIFGITATSVLDVWVNGVHQFESTDYTFGSNTITLQGETDTDDRIRFRVVIA